MGRLSVRMLPAVLAVAMLGGVASCGDDDEAAGTSGSTPVAQDVQLDTAKVEKAIKASVKEQRDVTAKVTCPESVRQAKDQNFVCLVKTKAFGTTRFAVVQTDDAGNVQYAAEQLEK